MPTYHIEDIIGTNLKLAKQGIAHVGNPDSAETVYYLVGSYFPVYNYINRNDGVWWSTDYKTTPGGRARYIKQEEKLFLPPGSTKTIEDEIKDKANAEKPWYEKLGEGAVDTVETLGIAAVVAWLGFKIFDSYGKKN